MVDTAQNPDFPDSFSTVTAILRLKSFTAVKTIEQIALSETTCGARAEEKKVLPLFAVGPVGGKSSLAERLKSLMQRVPIYVLSANGERSPSIIIRYACLIRRRRADSGKEYGIPPHPGTIMSPWAAKRLHEFGGDNKFRVVKVWPSILSRLPSPKRKPGDENNQIFRRWSARWIFVTNITPRTIRCGMKATGALCRANRGSWSSSRCLKAPIKALHPLLTATQKVTTMVRKGTSAPPLMASYFCPHSNESEWVTFRNNKITKRSRPCLYCEGACCLANLRRDQNLRETT